MIVIYWALLTSAMILGPIIILGLLVYAVLAIVFAGGVTAYGVGWASKRLVLSTRPAWPLAYTAVPAWGVVSLVFALAGRGFGSTESAFLCLFASFVGFMVWATKRRAAGGRVISA